MRIRFRYWVLVLALSSSLAIAAELPGGLVDPTRPLGDLTTWHVAKSDLILTSVIITGKKKVAVINGQQISEGQVVGGAEVVSIHPGRVILLRGDRAEELKVHQYDVKHPVVKHSVDQQSKKKLRL